MSGRRNYSPARFREAAIYVLVASRKKDGPDPRDLWAVLFHIDMEAYRMTGQSLTGATWVKTENGVRPRGRGESRTRPKKAALPGEAPHPSKESRSSVA